MTKGKNNSGLLLGQARMHENQAERLRKKMLTEGTRFNTAHPDFKSMSGHIQTASKLREQHSKAVKDQKRFEGLRKKK